MRNGSGTPSRREFLRTTSAIIAGSALGGITSVARAGETSMSRSAAPVKDIVILLYDRMTALDAVGPYEVLRCVPGVSVRFVARNPGLVRPDSGLQMLNAEHGIADVASADVLIVPGGDASGPLRDPAVIDWVARMHQTTKWTTSVCVGSLILGAAGLLKGLRATSHWNVLPDLRHFGAVPVEERYVREGKIITAAGVSAGLDMALSLVAMEHGEEMARAVQLVIEYDPQPPFTSGSTKKASAATVAQGRQIIRDMYSRPFP